MEKSTRRFGILIIFLGLLYTVSEFIFPVSVYEGMRHGIIGGCLVGIGFVYWFSNLKK